jgi:hypothetical protein
VRPTAGGERLQLELQRSARAAAADSGGYRLSSAASSRLQFLDHGGVWGMASDPPWQLEERPPAPLARAPRCRLRLFPRAAVLPWWTSPRGELVLHCFRAARRAVADSGVALASASWRAGAVPALPRA